MNAKSYAVVAMGDERGTGPWAGVVEVVAVRRSMYSAQEKAKDFLSKIKEAGAEVTEYNIDELDHLVPVGAVWATEADIPGTTVCVSVVEIQEDTK